MYFVIHFHEKKRLLGDKLLPVCYTLIAVYWRPLQTCSFKIDSEVLQYAAINVTFHISSLLLQVPSSFPNTNKHWYADIQMIQKLLMGTVMGVNIMH